MYKLRSVLQHHVATYVLDQSILHFLNSKVCMTMCFHTFLNLIINSVCSKLNSLFCQLCSSCINNNYCCVQYYYTIISLVIYHNAYVLFELQQTIWSTFRIMPFMLIIVSLLTLIAYYAKKTKRHSSDSSSAKHV